MEGDVLGEQESVEPKKQEGSSQEDQQVLQGTRNHKDLLFCDIFSIKENALSLYNATNDTDYTDAGALEIYTIAKTLFITIHNDVAVCFHGHLELFEQQSTKNANMPLREFLYSAEEYAKWVNRNNKDLFGEKLVQIPAPKCFELYNGKTNEPDRFEKRLSEAFMHPAPGYEWTVHVININAGHSKAIMDKCRPLKAYSVFVQKVRDNLAAEMGLTEAIERAVDYCIGLDLLAGYFAENRGRVVDMVWTEYNAKLHEENIKEESRKEGRDTERVISIRNVMSTLGVGAERAMEILRIPGEERGKYVQLV